MNLSIRNRIVLVLSLTLAALAGAYAVSLWYVARERLTSELDQRLHIEALVTADLIRLAPTESQYKLQMRDIVEAEELESPERSFDIEVRQGTALTYRRPPAESMALLISIAFNPDAQGVAWQQLKGHRIRICQVKFQHLGQTWFIRVAADERESVQSLATLRRDILLGIPMVLVAAGLLSYWLAGRALKPLINVAADASSISAANLEHRVAVPATGDEIARLAAGFNELLDRLQAAFAELRRFTGDASHELRTPLTVIRSVGEMALTKNMTSQQYRDTIGHMLEEADRLTQLVESLLMLARGDAGEPTAAPSPVVPVELVKVLCATLRPLAEELGQSLLVHGSADSPTVMNANLVSLAVFNVIHNAIKFTPRGGRIDIHVGSADSAISIVVDDTGPGIAADEREKVFDRFYRSKRVPSSMGRGFGLGLPIARSAVAKLGGTVTVGQAASGGARISMFIPKQSSAYS